MHRLFIPRFLYIQAGNMHPIDVAYKQTMDGIDERLSKIKAEVSEIELLATTKIAPLYDEKIAALRASAVTMQSQVDELKALIGKDCSAVEEEGTAHSEKQQKRVTPSEWNKHARQSNSMVSRVDEPLIALRGLDNKTVPHFPLTASDLGKISRMFL